MTTEGDFPYLYKSAFGAWSILFGGVLSARLGVLFGEWSLYYGESSFGWAGLLMAVFGLICLYFGVGSLRGQRRDVAAGFRDAPHPSVRVKRHGDILES
jgi:hypothetical protein